AALAAFLLRERIDFLAAEFVNVRVQHAHERQIAIAFGEVQPVTDDEEIGDFKPDVVRLHVFKAAPGFVEQNAGADAARFENAQLAEHPVKGPARIENVVHQQHVAAADVEPQFLGDHQFAGFGAGAIAGNPNEIKPKWQRKIANQIRQKHDGPV